MLIALALLPANRIYECFQIGYCASDILFLHRNCLIFKAQNVAALLQKLPEVRTGVARLYTLVVTGLEHKALIESAFTTMMSAPITSLKHLIDGSTPNV